jgi:TPR repeat protein
MSTTQGVSEAFPPCPSPNPQAAQSSLVSSSQTVIPLRPPPPPENPRALHELGLLYEAPQTTDSSVFRDETYSFSFFQQAADLGYKFSQFRLGCAYEYGLFNCPIDPRQSILWYSRAAAQGEHQSEMALSGWYLTGSEGVLQQSDTEAYLWARRAAMSGLAKAEFGMGYFTELGIGVPANLEDAKRWYWRAAGLSSPSSL